MRKLFDILKAIKYSPTSVAKSSFVYSKPQMITTDMTAVAPKVWVRCVSHEDKIQAKLTYPPYVGRMYELNRFISERISQTLLRLSANIQKKSTSGSKRKASRSLSNQSTASDTQDFSNEVIVTLTDSMGVPINPDLHNCHAWSQGNKLIIGGDVYQVEVNSPTVLQISLPNRILSGYPVYPAITFEFTDSHCSDFSWYRVSSSEEILISTDRVYSPIKTDEGFKLKLKVVPKLGDRMGIIAEVISQNPVEAGPLDCPFERRARLTSAETDENSFRIASYNILADVYTDSDFSRDVLFKYCPKEYLDYSYRQNLILKEILGFNADIICLQEMDKSHFLNYYQPVLLEYGYQSQMLIKRHRRLPNKAPAANPEKVGFLPEQQEEQVEESEGDMVCINEGSAIFYKSSKFKLYKEYNYNINISEELSQDDSDSKNHDIKELIRKSPGTQERLFYRSGTSLQVLLLESLSDPSKRLCVATTHLYFHPEGTVVRLLQTAASIRYLQRIKAALTAKHINIPIVYCGDFNTTPDRPVVEFITKKSIGRTHSVWSTDFDAAGLDLSHSVSLDSACGFPPYTNFVPEFQACLDYIFYEKDLLQVKSTVPVPDKKDLKLYGGGIPSRVFPSDHVSLICDLSWI